MYKALLICLLSLPLTAQNFATFPDSNATWTNSYAELETQPFFHLVFKFSVKYCLSTKDTLLNGLSYQQLFLCGNQMQYFGAYRQDSARLFLVPKDSTEALKIYDFNYGVGDTIKDCYSAQFGFYANSIQVSFEALSNFGPWVVNNIDTVYSSLGAHRRLDFGMAPWIEGIGNTQGFLWDPLFNISGFGIALECHSRGDSIYYNSLGNQGPLNPAEVGPCAINFSVGEEMLSTLSAFPNPSKGLLQLNNMEPHYLRIWNAQGAKVFEGELRPKATLNFSHLPQGVYNLELNGSLVKWVKQ
jgi:hypothetical protein